MSASNEDSSPSDQGTNRRLIIFGEGSPESVQIRLTHELKVYLHDLMLQTGGTSMEEAAAAVLLTRVRERLTKLVWADALGWANRFPEDPDARFRIGADLWS